MPSVTKVAAKSYGNTTKAGSFHQCVTIRTLTKAGSLRNCVTAHDPQFHKLNTVIVILLQAQGALGIKDHCTLFP